LDSSPILNVLEFKKGGQIWVRRVVHSWLWVLLRFEILAFIFEHKDKVMLRRSNQIIPCRIFQSLSPCFVAVSQFPTREIRAQSKLNSTFYFIFPPVILQRFKSTQVDAAEVITPSSSNVGTTIYHDPHGREIPSTTQLSLIRPSQVPLPCYQVLDNAGEVLGDDATVPEVMDRPNH
jgi:hypothetical protein